MNVLGIETSCDEIGVGIYASEKGLVGHVLRSYMALHASHGGVVPELAARDHIRYLLPLIQEVLRQAKLKIQAINGVAYTAGPGLAGALLVGASIGRSLGWALNVPTVGIHHMEGHLLAPMLEDDSPAFPFLALLVSGGHTLLVAVQGIGQYRILGDTLDDAVGEAFDKTARLMGLGYPGGAALSRLAEKGDAYRYPLPKPLLDRPGLDFSFSGLKTAVIRLWQNTAVKDEGFKADLAASFQRAVIDTLVEKCRRGLQMTGMQRLVVAGGVSANKPLRTALDQLMQQRGRVYYPRLEFCTDNGAMIAFTGFLRLQAGNSDDLKIRVLPRWSLMELTV